MPDVLNAIRDTLDVEMLTLASLAADELAAAGRDDRGLTRRGLYGEAVVQGEAVVATAGVRGVPHARFVHDGRQPNRRPPPKQDIKAWLMRKHGVPEREAERRAFPSARAIGRRGLPGTPFLTDPFERRLPAIQEAVQTAAASASRQRLTDATGRTPGASGDPA